MQNETGAISTILSEELESKDGVQEKERMYQKLYHVTGWDEVKTLEPGDALTLKPGTQNAQGEGVYFSENLPRYTAAEGAKGNPKAVVEIVAENTEGWYRSKEAFAKKYNKPRTWHTKGKDIRLIVIAKMDIEEDGYKGTLIHCDWRFIQEREEKPEEISKGVRSIGIES